MCVCTLSHVWLFVTPWTVACQAPLSMGFSRQEYWNGLPFPPPGNFPDPGIETTSPASPALAGRFFTTAPPGKPITDIRLMIIIYLWDNWVCFDGFGVVFNKGDTQEKMFCLLKLMLSYIFSLWEFTPQGPFSRNKLSSLVGECCTLLIYMFYVHPTRMLVRGAGTLFYLEQYLLHVDI